MTKISGWPGTLQSGWDQDGKPLPGVAQVAMQQGRFVGKMITNRETGQWRRSTISIKATWQ